MSQCPWASLGLLVSARCTPTLTGVSVLCCGARGSAFPPLVLSCALCVPCPWMRPRCVDRSVPAFLNH